MAPKICANCNASSTTRALKTCGRCRAVDYCNRDCQKAHYHFHKRDCLKTKATEDKLAKEPTKAEQRGEVCMEAVPFLIVGHDDKGNRIVRDADGNERTIPDDNLIQKWFEPTPQYPQGHIKFSPFSEEQMAAMAHLDDEQRRRLQSSIAEAWWERGDARVRTTEEEKGDKERDVKLRKVQRDFQESKAKEKVERGEKD